MSPCVLFSSYVPHIPRRSSVSSVVLFIVLGYGRSLFWDKDLTCKVAEKWYFFCKIFKMRLVEW